MSIEKQIGQIYAEARSRIGVVGRVQSEQRTAGYSVNYGFFGSFFHGFQNTAMGPYVSESAFLS